MGSFLVLGGQFFFCGSQNTHPDWVKTEMHRETLSSKKSGRWLVRYISQLWDDYFMKILIAFLPIEIFIYIKKRQGRHKTVNFCATYVFTVRKFHSCIFFWCGEGGLLKAGSVAFTLVGSSVDSNSEINVHGWEELKYCECTSFWICCRQSRQAASQCCRLSGFLATFMDLTGLAP